MDVANPPPTNPEMAPPNNAMSDPAPPYSQYPPKTTFDGPQAPPSGMQQQMYVPPGGQHPGPVMIQAGQSNIVIMAPANNMVDINVNVVHRLGITQIVLGGVLMLCNIGSLASVLIGPSVISHGIWGGILMMTAGGIGMSAAKSKRRGIATACMVLSILAAIAALVTTILSGIACAIGSTWYGYLYQLDIYVALNGVMVVCAVAELIVSIICASYCGKATCCNGGQTVAANTVVQYQQPHMISQGQMMAPQGQIMAPQGQMMAPQGQMMAPQGQMMAPQGQMMAPQGQMMIPQGQMMAPQGQMMTYPGGSGYAPVGQQPMIYYTQQGAPPHGVPQTQDVAPQKGQY